MRLLPLAVFLLALVSCGDFEISLGPTATPDATAEVENRKWLERRADALEHRGDLMLSSIWGCSAVPEIGLEFEMRMEERFPDFDPFDAFGGLDFSNAQQTEAILNEIQRYFDDLERACSR